MEEKKSFIENIPFGGLSLACLLFTYFVGGTIGMLVIPVILCIIFIIPLGIVFAILDIVIRKKRVLPIISLIGCLWLVFGLVFMFGTIFFDILSAGFKNFVPNLKEIVPRLKELLPELKELFPKLKDLIPKLKELI